VIVSSDPDVIYLDASKRAKLGAAVAVRVRALLVQTDCAEIAKPNERRRFGRRFYQRKHE